MIYDDGVCARATNLNDSFSRSDSLFRYLRRRQENSGLQGGGRDRCARRLLPGGSASTSIQARSTTSPLAPPPTAASRPSARAPAASACCCCCCCTVLRSGLRAASERPCRRSAELYDAPTTPLADASGRAGCRAHRPRHGRLKRRRPDASRGGRPLQRPPRVVLREPLVPSQVPPARLPARHGRRAARRQARGRRAPRWRRRRRLRSRRRCSPTALSRCMCTHRAGVVARDCTFLRNSRARSICTFHLRPHASRPAASRRPCPSREHARAYTREQAVSAHGWPPNHEPHAPHGTDAAAAGRHAHPVRAGDLQLRRQDF